MALENHASNLPSAIGHDERGMSCKVQLKTDEHIPLEIVCEGNSIDLVLEDLQQREPTHTPPFFSDGKVRPYVKVFLNQDDIQYLKGLDSRVYDGDVITLFASVKTLT